MSGSAGDALAAGSLAVLAATGDRIAFARLVDAFYADTLRVAYVVTGGDREAAEDAVQAAWSTAWQKLRTVREPERIKPWLLAVAANEARAAARRRRRHPIVELDVAQEDPAGPDPAGLVSELDLRRAIARYAPEDRALLALRYVAGLDSTEIGEATHRRASTVRTRLSTLLARLRKDLSDV